MLDIFNNTFNYIAIWYSDSALWVLFITGFLSATLLPGGSEASLIATLSLHQYHVVNIVFIATVGNTLGGLTNYILGLWLPCKKAQEKQANRALAWMTRYGYWSLLLSWLPIIGDPLCLAAGWLRMKFLPCLLLILIGKAMRYTVLAAVFYGVF